jgi:3-isopropylmalate/(R)-2-methylmalate dehydratase small subunit
MQDTIRGRVWVLDNDVDTDGIIGGKYLQILDPNELKKHVFEIALPEFAANALPGDIIVAGTAFGSGSSREAAPAALKAAGVGAVVADSFARIFFRNSINLGVLAIEAPGVRSIFEKGQIARIEMHNGRIVNETTQREVRFPALPPHLLSLLEAGGLVEKVRRELSARRSQATA